MHGMGKGAQALRLCLGVGLGKDDHPGSRIYVVGRVVLGGGTLAQKQPLLAFLSLCALTGAWWWGGPGLLLLYCDNALTFLRTYPRVS